MTTTRRSTLATLAAAFATAPAAFASPATPPLPPLPTAPFTFLQPGPVTVPRRTLDLRFAVLLMRSCYDAVDAVDVIPMAGFQRAFWKARESETEAYSQMIAPLEARKGDLTSAEYFDFISYSQFVAANDALKGHPPRVFDEDFDDCELTPDVEECPIQTRAVRRELPLDDADLPAEFYRRAGDLVYNNLRSGFRGEDFQGVPAPLSSSSSPSSSAAAAASDVAMGFTALLRVLVSKGYALSGDVVVVDDGSDDRHCTLRVELQGAATQWGASALAARRAKVLTLHEAMALDGWLRAGSSGWRAVSVDLETGDATRATTWRLVKDV